MSVYVSPNVQKYYINHLYFGFRKIVFQKCSLFEPYFILTRTRGHFYGNFYAKKFLSQTFFGQIFTRKKCLHQKFCYAKLFTPKNVLRQKFFYAKIFTPKNVLHQKCFTPKNYIKFLRVKFLRQKKVLHQTIFYTKKCIFYARKLLYPIPKKSLKIKFVYTRLNGGSKWCGFV